MVPDGQLSDIERGFLTEIVIKLKPKKVLESGTWKGGGSTLSITKGLFENKYGVLDTYEEYQPFYETAKDFYTLSEYNNFIRLHNDNFLDGLKKLPENYFEDVGLIFLDGGDETPTGSHKLAINEYINDYNLSENLQSFKFLSNMVKPNTVLLLHDWSIIEGRGNFIKRYLEDINYSGFELIRVIDGSTGLAYILKK